MEVVACAMAGVMARLVGTVLCVFLEFRVGTAYSRG